MKKEFFCLVELEFVAMFLFWFVLAFVHFVSWG